MTYSRLHNNLIVLTRSKVQVWEHLSTVQQQSRHGPGSTSSRSLWCLGSDLQCAFSKLLLVVRELHSIRLQRNKINLSFLGRKRILTCSPKQITWEFKQLMSFLQASPVVLTKMIAVLKAEPAECFVSGWVLPCPPLCLHSHSHLLLLLPTH